MKAAVLAASLSVLGMTCARAQVTSTVIPNSPWTVSTIGGSNPVCTLMGMVGQGRLNFLVYGGNPGSIRVQLDRQGWTLATGKQVRAIFHFAGAPDVPLTGLKGENASTLFLMPPDDVRSWVHGFSAGQSATIEFPGTSEPSWTFDLRGTSPAVDAVQKCITSEKLTGLPPPFASAAAPPTVKPGSRCLSYDPAVATVVGTVGMATGYGPPGFGENPRTDPKFQYARLVLNQPVCVTGGQKFDFDDADDVRELELFSIDHGKIFDAKPWVGKRVSVTGTIEQTQVGTEAATAHYVNVRSIQLAP